MCKKYSEHKDCLCDSEQCERCYATKEEKMLAIKLLDELKGFKTYFFCCNTCHEDIKKGVEENGL